MKITKLLAIPSLAILSMVASHADTITQTQTFSGNPVGYSSALVFNGFDSSLGTLTSVTITISNVSVTGSISFTNNATTTETVRTISFDGVFSAVDSNGNEVDANIDTPNYGSNTTRVASGVTENFPSETTDGDPSSATTVISGSDLAAYTSSTTVTVDVTGSFGNTVTTLNGSAYTVVNNYVGSGEVTVTYDYTASGLAAVPEPAQTGAVLLGLGLCIMIVRRTLKGKSVGSV